MRYSESQAYTKESEVGSRPSATKATRMFFLARLRRGGEGEGVTERAGRGVEGGGLGVGDGGNVEGSKDGALSNLPVKSAANGSLSPSQHSTKPCLQTMVQSFPYRNSAAPCMQTEEKKGLRCKAWSKKKLKSNPDLHLNASKGPCYSLLYAWRLLATTRG